MPTYKLEIVLPGTDGPIKIKLEQNDPFDRDVLALILEHADKHVVQRRLPFPEPNFIARVVNPALEQLRAAIPATPGNGQERTSIKT